LLSENKEIKALLHLLDDPDEDVYHTVSEKLLSMGKDIIPSLEHVWETIADTGIQERIEILIHRVHLRELTEEFLEWKTAGCDLLHGALLVARYHYPDMQATQILQQVEKMRRNIWLELNNYLTPMEKVNVFNSIFYSYYKQEGIEVSYDNPDSFLINKTLETRKGNSISNGILYLILCELLDLPVKAINIPRQFILAYLDEQYPLLNPVGHASERIVLYIDPLNGQMYSHQDVENYFKRISVPPVASYFRPLENLRIIRFLIEELAKCFDNQRNHYKMDELKNLAASLEG
jgi:regulator of sirC expression with transglutaminase-like and TPR domain